MSLGSAAFLKKELTGNYGLRSIGRLRKTEPLRFLYKRPVNVLIPLFPSGESRREAIIYH